MPNQNKIVLAAASTLVLSACNYEQQLDVDSDVLQVNQCTSNTACVPGVIDHVAPMLAQVTAVATPATDSTPDFTFSSDEAGTITYGGDCASATTAAVVGNNTVTFNAMADGAHSNCTVTVTDASGNPSSALAINSFTIDSTAPILTQVTAVPNTNDTTPNYTFSSSESGTIAYGGDCSSPSTSAINGNNTVSFNALSYAIHGNCTLQVTDGLGNASAVLIISSFRVVKPKPMNDTGITLCGDYAYGYSEAHHNNVVCATAGATTTTAGTDGNGDPVPAGQDAVYGRDANLATNSNSDGHKGFSFTKLKADGTALAIQNGTWSDAGSEAAGTKWSCVQDNVTGLVWEVKTNDGGLRDKDWTYSWYNTDSTNNGNNAGYADYANNCFDAARCDTQKYVVDVNLATLCGANDWRMPRKDELLSIITRDRIGPVVDTGFIPNTITNGWYWSGSTYANDNYMGWVVELDDGTVFENYKNNSYFVRLVRGGM